MASAESIVKEVEAFFRAYNDAFNREDHAAFLASFVYPVVLISAERGMMVANTREEFAPGHDFVMKMFKDRGWTRSAIDRLHVWLAGENMAMLSADVTRYAQGDNVLERGRYFYTIRNEGQGWKILTSVEILPPFTGPNIPGDKPSDK